MFKKSRQLIRVQRKGVSYFIETPGYMYYYKPFGQYLFVHYKVAFDTSKGGYCMDSYLWVVTEPRTGLVINSRTASKTRKRAIEAARMRLLEIPIEQYHEAVLLGLANAPEHKPRFMFINRNIMAVEVEDGYEPVDSQAIAARV